MAGSFGNGIKSIQYGEKEIAAAASGTQTITAVVVDKSFLHYSYCGAAADYDLTGTLTNTTTITWTARGADTFEIGWYVVEYY